MNTSIICKVLLLSCALSAATATYTDEEYQTQFINWMHSHGRHYSSDEFALRFKVFKSNMDYVQEWNSRGHSTAVLGLNGFADISNQEFKKYIVQSKTIVTDEEIQQSHTALKAQQQEAALDLLDIGRPNLDWVALGVETPVEDQGQCDAGWAFSVAGAVEAAYIRNGGVATSLSKQQLISCSAESNGCEGKEIDPAFNYIIAAGGIESETTYPYREMELACAYNASRKVTSITSFTKVTTHTDAALATAVASHGPVSVIIDGSHMSFQLYVSGIYDEPLCSSVVLDSPLLAVGYGGGVTILNILGIEITTPQTYWILKNSFNANWGINGYMTLKFGSNHCGVASKAAYPNI
eukprot:gene14909-17629_t